MIFKPDLLRSNKFINKYSGAKTQAPFQNMYTSAMGGPHQLRLQQEEDMQACKTLDVNLQMAEASSSL